MDHNGLNLKYRQKKHVVFSRLRKVVQQQFFCFEIPIKAKNEKNIRYLKIFSEANTTRMAKCFDESQHRKDEMFQSF